MCVCVCVRQRKMTSVYEFDSTGLLSSRTRQSRTVNMIYKYLRKIDFNEESMSTSDGLKQHKQKPIGFDSLKTIGIVIQIGFINYTFKSRAGMLMKFNNNIVLGLCGMEEGPCMIIDTQRGKIEEVDISMGLSQYLNDHYKSSELSAVYQTLYTASNETTKKKRVASSKKVATKKVKITHNKPTNVVETKSSIPKIDLEDIHETVTKDVAMKDKSSVDDDFSIDDKGDVNIMDAIAAPVKRRAKRRTTVKLEDK